jgi:diguanylate cyclase (GGDEF)-like protein/PAS domain S-box-containing protein
VNETAAPSAGRLATAVSASVFYSATVSDAAALLVVESAGETPLISWGNDSAARLLGHPIDDLRRGPLADLVPGLADGGMALLLRERTAQVTVPVRTATGSAVECVLVAMPEPSGKRWVVRLIATANELERALRATAEAHERRFATITERSPVPMLLSEQGMRLAHVNGALCQLVGLRAEQLLGTGWLDVLHPDDAEAVIDQVTAVLDGGEGRVQVRLLLAGQEVRTAVLRLSPLLTPGAGAGFVGTLEDITERLAFEARLAHQAAHDPLTGLPNRTLLTDWAGERFTAGASSLSCLFIDVDDFKLVNDSLGHTAGDALLVELATRLRATARPGDLVVRFGGDEFVVVCQDLTEGDSVGLAERIAATLCRPVRLCGVDVRPYVSVGVTVQTAEHADANDLIRDCDIALYQAKTSGRGTIALLDERGRAAARDRLRLVADLRDAIEHRSLTVSYQPILRAHDGAAVGVEALARWRHPERGQVSPAEFIPLAEESGLIDGLGQLVLDETCRQLTEWTRQLGPEAPLRAQVNVSALQLRPALPAQARTALDRHGVTPSRLSVELTESALMTDPEAARGILQDLRDLGVHLAIDDFGTGYSSLAYLRHLPVDTLKVDRSFVAELSAGHDEIAAAVIGLARTLGLSTVAEGVETPEQAAELTRLGATYLQGFGLGLPMTGDECTTWFASRQEPAP